MSPVILAPLSQVWICGCRSSVGLNTGLTQSIKEYTLVTQNKHHNYALRSFVFPVTQWLVDDNTKASRPRKNALKF